MPANATSLLALMLSSFVGLGVLYGGGGVLWNDVIDAFGISKGVFGLAQSLGVIAGLPVLVFGGRLADRFDKRLLLAVSLAITVIPAVGIIFGSVVGILVLLLIIQGIGVTALDLSNNALAMDVERSTRRHIMGPLHATFSVGSLIGPLVAGLLIWLGGDYKSVYAVIAVMFAGLAVFALVSLKQEAPPSLAPEQEHSPLHALYLLKNRTNRDLAAIAGIAFASELLIAQWVGIYFQDERHYAKSVTVIALSLNGAAMAIGRFGNGPLNARIGAIRMLLFQGCVTMLGGLLIAAGPNAAVAVAGCAIAGFGLAGMAPTTLSLVGLANPTAPGAASGAVLLVGYAGIAVAPFLAGMVSTFASTRIALAGVAFGGLAVVVVARRIVNEIRQHSAQPPVPA
ncbi:MAG: MFS transporter [Thermomicrobiales bacterium]